MLSNLLVSRAIVSVSPVFAICLRALKIAVITTNLLRFVVFDDMCSKTLCAMNTLKLACKVAKGLEFVILSD